jgi:hypothetical protein
MWAASDPSTLARLSFFRRRLPIQSEFSVSNTNLMAVRRIVAIFVSARVQLDHPIRVLRAYGRFARQWRK